LKNKKLLNMLNMVIILLIITSLIPLGISNNLVQNKKINSLESTSVKNIYINSTFVINSTTIDPLTGEKGMYGFNGNVIIGSSGNLTVLNANVYFIQDSLSPVSLSIVAGGSIYLKNSTLTVTPDRYYPSLNFSVNDYGGQIYFNGARILYPGWFNVTGSNVYLYNTTFANVTSQQINLANQFGLSPTNDPFILNGPTPLFTSDTIAMKNVFFYKLPQNAYGKTLIASGPPSNVHFPQYIYPGQILSIGNGFSLSPGSVFPYTTFSNGTILLNYSTTNNNSYNSSIKVYYKNILLYSNILLPQYKAKSASFLLNFSNIIYLINYSAITNPGNIFVNISGPSAGELIINSIELNLYTDKSLTNQIGFLKHQFNLIRSTLYGENVFISANSNFSNGNPSKNYIFLQNSQAYILNLTVCSEKFSVGYHDPPYLMDQSSSIYLYRNAIVKIQNYNGIPLSNLNVSASPDNLPIFSNGKVILDNQIVSNLNNILYSSLGIGPTLTNSSGIAILPLFTDNVSMSYWPNALYGGNYIFNISAGTRLLKSSEIGLPYFPNLNLTGNNYKINETVIVPDIVLKSISIPLEMIHNQTYTISSEIFVQGESISNVPVSFNLPGFSKIIIVNLNENKDTFVNISYTVPYDVLPGNYTVNISVNPSRTIYESNYSNNYKVATVKIFPDTDVGVSKPVFSKMNLYSADFINFTVYNLGTDAASNVHVELMLTPPNGAIMTNYWILNISGNKNISLSYKFIPQIIGTYSVTVYAPYYWDINYSNNYNFNTTSSSIVYFFIPSNTGFSILGNITPNMPMSIELYSEIGVNGVILSQAPNVTVSFNDLTNGVNIGSTQTYYSNGAIYANLTTNYFYYGHKYLVGLVLTNPYENLSYVVYVYYNFTLYVPSISYTIDPISSTYMNGTTIPIYINLTTGSTSINDLNVIIEFPTLSIMHRWLLNTTPYENISLVYYLNATLNMGNNNEIQLPYEIYITYPEISPYNVILDKGQITIFEKPNIYIQSFTYKYNSVVKNINNVPAGTYFEVIMVIGNDGGTLAKGNTTISLVENGNIIYTKNITNIAPGSTVNITTNVTATLAGENTLTIIANYTYLPQKINGPKSASFNFIVVPPNTEVIMYSSSTTITSGQRLTLTFMVLNINATQQLGRNVFLTDISLTIVMKSGSISNTYNIYIGSNGIGILTVSPNQAGKYSIIASYSYFGQQQNEILPTQINVQGQSILPLWLIVVIVIIVIVIGIFAYSFMKYKKVEKNLMVCGNCGSLIPADSEKCPVCGVVFEKENVKCGNCGSWIKKDARYCPVCGALYMDENDPDYKKYSKLREEYNLEIQKYKEEAKRELGDKFTDEEFFRWWNSKPEFITFEKWIEKKEEEKGQTVECPVCGTLNPKGAKFCKVCGSPLPGNTNEKK